MAKRKTAGQARSRGNATAAAAETQGDFFDQAAEASKPTNKSPGSKAKTLLRIPDVAGELVHTAVRGLRSAKLKIKSGKAQEESSKAELAPIVLDLFAAAWIAAGDQPPKPVHVLNKDGDRLTHVLQDKSNGAVLADGVCEQPMVGYAINMDVLGQPGVREKLSAAIDNSGLSQEQKQTLLVKATVRKTRESLVPHLATLAGGDAGKLAKALELLGGPITRYLSS